MVPGNNARKPSDWSQLRLFAYNQRIEMMASIFKKIILVFGFLSIVGVGYCQELMMSYGPVFTTTDQIIPIVNGGKGDANTDYLFSMSYEHFFVRRPFSLFASFGRFDGYTFMFFEEGGFISYGNEIVGTVFSGVKVNRFDTGVIYNLFNRKKFFYLSPFVAMGVQISRKTGVEIYNDLTPVNGPNYFELEPMSAVPMNTTQIVPSAGFRTGLVFWKRLDIGLGIQGVYAYKPYQKMYLKYAYKGVEQPMAEYESTGTGLFVTVGVGYRFVKLMK
jgi:hypothetical protein